MLPPDWRKSLSVFLPVLAISVCVTIVIISHFSISTPPFSNVRTDKFMITVDNPKSLFFENISENKNILSSYMWLNITEDKREYLDLEYKILLHNLKNVQTLYITVPSYMIIQSYRVLLGDSRSHSGIGVTHPASGLDPYFESSWEYNKKFDVTYWELNVNTSAFTSNMCNIYEIEEISLDILEIRVNAKWYGLIHDPRNKAERIITLDFDMNKYFYDKRNDNTYWNILGIPIINEFKVLVIYLPNDVIYKPCDITPAPYIYSSNNIIWKNYYFKDLIIASYSREKYSKGTIIDGFLMGLLLSSLGLIITFLVEFVRKGYELRDQFSSSKLYDLGCFSIISIILSAILSYFYIGHSLQIYYIKILETGFSYYLDFWFWGLIIFGLFLSYLLSYFYGEDYSYSFIIIGFSIMFFSIGLSFMTRIGYSYIDLFIGAVLYPLLIYIFHHLIILGMKRRDIRRKRGFESVRWYLPW